jgi:hypothetical protein
MVHRGPPPFPRPTRFQLGFQLVSTCTALPRRMRFCCNPLSICLYCVYRAARQGLTFVHFSAQLKPFWSHLPVDPCLIDWGKIMHPTYSTNNAYVEPKEWKSVRPCRAVEPRNPGPADCWLPSTHCTSGRRREDAASAYGYPGTL